MGTRSKRQTREKRWKKTTGLDGLKTPGRWRLPKFQIGSKQKIGRNVRTTRKGQLWTHEGGTLVVSESRTAGELKWTG